jgi:Zn-dependent protease
MSESRETHRSLEPRRAHDDGLEPLREQPVFTSDREPKKRAGFGVIGAVLLAVLMKGKSLLVLLKALPAGKFMLTTFSMLAMVWFEAMRSGIWFGIGFVLLILVHELGHGYAMKRAGVEAGWPIFIPFFGAMIAMKGLPQDRSAEAEIAYGGPLAGTAAALIAAGLGLALDSRLFLALAYVGFFLNLFNLTPISPLDGGRVAQAFSRRAWIVGAILLGGLFLTTGAPMLLLIGLMALPRLFNRQSEDERPELEPAVQRAWAFRYFGLASFLAAGSYFASQLMQRTAT